MVKLLVDDAGHTGDHATVTVRMYTVGFGDCFLVTAGRPGEQPWRMLVDCGVHFKGRSAHPLSSVVADIVSEVTVDGTPRIDLVVATHRHQDHISGFTDPLWDTVEVADVWLPWCEDPADPVSQRLRTRLDAMARTLALRFAASDPDSAQLALNSLTNEKAMTTLRQGFAGKATRTYVSADRPVRTELPGLRGGRIYVLGPTRDEAAIRRMEPTKAERWLTTEEAGSVLGSEPSPFGDAYEVRVRDGATSRAATRAEYEAVFTDLSVSEKLWASFTPPVGGDALVAASWLDRALNNTSIVFVLEVGDQRLLFPGDAQWGVWESILTNPDARALLAGVDLYKVGHHGSHNGTPRSLAGEVFDESLVSLMSFQEMADWKAIPQEDLVESLAGAARTLLRPDEEPPPDARFSRHPEGLWTEVVLRPPTAADGAVVIGGPAGHRGGRTQHPDPGHPDEDDSPAARGARISHAF